MLLLLALVSKLIDGILNATTAGLISQATWAGFALLMAANAIHYSLRGRQVGSEQIYAALGAYLLAGLFFGQIYWVMDQFLPGSLGGTGTIENSITLGTAVYFSFVTLTSLGYGDIVALSDVARGLAVIEVVSGQLYLAVLVARLIGVLRHGLGDHN